jgi:hypothetical protein
MANIPSNLSYATVNGRFIVGYQDSADGGSEPDAIPAAGTIIFSPSTSLIKNVTASGGPVSIVPATVQATLDEEGYLCGYGSTRGIILVATDDEDGNPYDWTWRADFRLTEADGTPIAVEGFSFELPGGSDIDLTVLAPVQLANGTFYNIGPQGIQGIQGVQGPPGSIENFMADAPLYYDEETATLTFDDTDYIYTAGTGLNLLANEFEIDDTVVVTQTQLTSELANKANLASPTFTGTVTSPTIRLTSTTDASLSSTGHALQIGSTTSTNLIIDNDEIKARNNGSASGLSLNADGGNITLGSSASGITAQGTVTTSNGITNAQQKNALVASGFNSASGAFAQASRVVMTATASGSTAPTTRPDGTSLVAGDVWISF